MSRQYYIQIDGNKDGPHDLVTIMRRIRAKKIGPETPIFVDDAETTSLAKEIKDIAFFFSHEQAASSSNRSDIPVLTLKGLVGEGWRFTTEHNVMTVFSGGIVLLGILLAAGLVSALGPIIGSMLSCIVLLILHYLFLVCCLRAYRGQSFSSVFINQQLAPVLPILFFSAIVIALMMVGGFLLFLLPALLVGVYYIFVPFLIMDRRLSLIEAMYASRLLVQKHNARYQTKIAFLILMHIACMLLIIPVPITLPMFAAALAKIYEDISSS